MTRQPPSAEMIDLMRLAFSGLFPALSPFEALLARMEGRS